jgi:hypothetical protein
MDADAELDPLGLGYLRVLVSHAALNFDGASRCFDGTGKFDQHTVAGGLDDAAAMFGDCGVDKRCSESLQLRQRAFLVGTNQAAITGDIRRQDSRQSPLYVLAAQDAPRLGKLDVHHSSIMGRCPARTNVRFGVKLRRTQCEQMSSGLPLKADIAQCNRHVSKVPQPDSCTAANWNAQQHRGGHSKNSGWWQIAPSPNYSQASLQCRGHTVIDPVRCLAVQPDAAPTDQLNARSHGGLV